MDQITATWQEGLEYNIIDDVEGDIETKIALFKKHIIENDYFLNQFCKDIMTNIISPAFKKLKQEDKDIIKNRKSLAWDSYDRTVDRFDANILDILYIEDEAPVSVWFFEVIIKGYQFVDSFFNVLKQTIKDHNNDAQIDVIYQLYRRMIKLNFLSTDKYNRPSFNVVSNNKSILKYNIDMIGQNQNFKYGAFDINEYDLSKLPKKHILRTEKITRAADNGQMSTVLFFDSKPNVVLKMFNNGVRINNDIKRIKKMIRRVYSGSASMDDMHYFELISIPDKTHPDNKFAALHMALMPKIVPLDGSEIERHPDNIGKLIKIANVYNLLKGQPGLTFKSFKTRVLNQYSNYDMNNEFCNKIMLAMWRARMEHKGMDFNTGNIGYFAARPDKFFFFDM
jgi:hypothetical protein